MKCWCANCYESDVVRSQGHETRRSSAFEPDPGDDSLATRESPTEHTYHLRTYSKPLTPRSHPRLTLCWLRLRPSLRIALADWQGQKVKQGYGAGSGPVDIKIGCPIPLCCWLRSSYSRQGKPRSELNDRAKAIEMQRTITHSLVTRPSKLPSACARRTRSAWTERRCCSRRRRKLRSVAKAATASSGSCLSCCCSW